MMSTQRHFLQKPFTLIVAVMYFLVFIFTTLATKTNSTFLDVIKFKFTKTPLVLTFGERAMNFVQIAAPLLLAVAFATLFFFYKKLPAFTSAALLLAALVALSGITVFVCLNAYNIIETFNEFSKSAAALEGEQSENNYIESLIYLISYHILLIVYAGSLSGFSLNIKKDSGKHKSALAFSVANGLLAIWSLVIALFPPELVTDYFGEPDVVKSSFVSCEITSALCFIAVAVFAFLYFMHHKKEKQS